MTSTAGMFNNLDLIEGTDETRREARAKRARRARVLAARAHRGWREYKPDELEQRRHAFQTLFVTPEGAVLAPMRTNVFSERLLDNMEMGCRVWNEGNSCAFSVDEYDNVTVFEPSPFRSATMLDLSIKQHEWRKNSVKMKERERELQLREFRQAQPLRQVTLADLERRQLPTVRVAADAILKCGGTLTVRHGMLEIALPEQLAPERAEHDKLSAPLIDAATVLLAAGNVVVGALESKSKKPLLERLPDAQVLAGGGLA